jgi:hypothetical protein
MRRLIVLVVIAATAVFVVPALAASKADRLVGNCTKSQVRPSAIVLFCGDDNEYVSKLKWSSFGAGTAKGSGVLYDNSCTPNCAAGKFEHFAASVVADKPHICSADHYTDYRSLTVHLSGLTASSKLKATEKFTLDCPIP